MILGVLNKNRVETGRLVGGEESAKIQVDKYNTPMLKIKSVTF